jgi:hypothetical protein
MSEKTLGENQFKKLSLGLKGLVKDNEMKKKKEKISNVTMEKIYRGNIVIGDIISLYLDTPQGFGFLYLEG